MGLRPVSATLKRLRIALIAGETSGDLLGAKLMTALRGLCAEDIEFAGVGGPAMEAEGLHSAFPMADIAVMGVFPVLKRLPSLFKRIQDATRSVLAAAPDALVIIDSPDFTHRVARRVRTASPELPIIDYVSPTVWAWRPGRAAAMRDYVDRVLALLPFEPAVHARLGGPPCDYVGHSLIERIRDFRADDQEARRREEAPPIVAVLPGSRKTLIARLMDDFGGAVAEASRRIGPLDVVIPTLPHVEAEVRARAEAWSIRPRFTVGPEANRAVFRTARAALAASGTATLELALAGVPTVGAYRVTAWEARLRFLVKLPHSILLPNLILGDNTVPEFLHERCSPGPLAEALAALVVAGPARDAQIQALTRLDARMTEGLDAAPSVMAARAVLRTIAEKSRGALPIPVA